MPAEQGIVKEIRGNVAVVKVERSSACKHCSARGICGVDFGFNRELLIEVENSLNAKEGDKVELNIPSGSLVKMALMVYFLPIISLIFGAYEGKEIFSAFGLSTTTGSVLGALILLVVSMVILRKVDKSIRNKSSYKIRMTRITG